MISSRTISLHVSEILYYAYVEYGLYMDLRGMSDYFSIQR